jgi:hypothetical protein
MVIGPIFSLDLAGQPVVVLNTHQAAGDLFGTTPIQFRPFVWLTNMRHTSQTADQRYTATGRG